jgi:Ca2+-transporting ATPase
MGRVEDFRSARADGDTSGAEPIAVRLVHRLPLRDRLQIPAMRHDPGIAAQLGRLRLQAGIRETRCNPRAASLTIRYDDPTTQTDLPALLSALGGFRLRDDTAAAGPRTGRSTAPPHRNAPRPEPAAAGDGEDWHLLELAQVIERLGASIEGLSPEEAARRLARDGPNLLSKMERRSDWQILIEQFNSAPVAMLGVSAAIALLTAAPVDAAIIAVVVGANATIGFLTERQAEETIASLAQIEGQRVRVLRDGKPIRIDAEEVVRGDILLLEPGVRLPADARLVKAYHLTVDESALTGESLPVKKKAEESAEPRTLADRHNMVHLGTTVSGGDGRAVVTEIGNATELGRIQSLASGAEQPMTPMQQRLAKMSTQLALYSSGICALVFVAGVMRGQPRLAMLNTAISLAVAAVPEGLPAISNSLLSIGIRRMREKGVLARRMDAIENLGTIDVLCVDKTGTLTENRMRVVALDTPDQQVFNDRPEEWPTAAAGVDARFWQVLTLCNEAKRKEGQWQGSSTESALLEAAEAAGHDYAALRGRFPQIKVRYRSERRPYMSTLHEDPRRKGFMLAVKGRPKQVLARCTHLRRRGRRVKLTQAMRDEIIARNDALMAESFRVLGVAWRPQPENHIGKTENLEWLGLVAMADPLRPEVVDLLPKLQEAGIRTLILTGDQRGTAAAVGRALHLNGDGDVAVLGADELEQYSDEQLEAAVGEAEVFARVSPAMKLKLVQMLQRSGHRVAMTGDGINDGPALKVADVGIAMGRSGSEVARSMADVLLTDDRLQSIVDAVEYGRSSYANLEKAIEYLLSTNFSEIEVMFASLVAGLETPLTPIQLLWINLLTDVFPSLAMGFEAPEYNVLRQPPSAFQEGMFTGRRLRRLLGQSALITTATMAAYGYGLTRYGVGPQARTQAFMTLTLGQLLQAFSSRSHGSSVFSRHSTPPNRLLVLAVGGSVLLQLAALAPGLRQLLGLSRVGPADLAVIGAGAVLPVLGNEALKEWRLRREAAQAESSDE